MKISVHSLSSGRHRMTNVSAAAEYDLAAAGCDLAFCGDIAVDATVNKMSDELFVAAEARAAVRAECGRCAKPFELSVTGRFEALYVPEARHDPAGSRTRRLESESQRILYYEGGVVDLGEQVLEALALAAPMKPLCRETCNGLCPRCGHDLNRGPCTCPDKDEFGKPFKRLLSG